MENPVLGPPAWQTWDNVRWYRNKKDGYCRNREGFLLHIAVYTSVHGPVLAGHHVHHNDHDRTNNSLDNLRSLSSEEHKRYHASVRTDAAWVDEHSSERARQRANAVWANRQPRTIICDVCGCTFQSIGMRTVRCSPECRREQQRRVAASRRDERRTSGTR